MCGSSIAVGFPKRWASMIKGLVRKTLNRMGIIAFRRATRIFVPEAEAYGIVARLAGRADPVVIDGGAHRGGAVDALSGIFPNATFHCFEPDPSLGQELSHRFARDPRVHVVQAALGERPGRAKFNINVSRPTSSLLAAAEFVQSDLKQLTQLVEQVEVDVVTIDTYCRDSGVDRVDIIKLDLQGYDYQALLGAKAVLANARVVLVEVLIVELYKGCGLFPDILRLMQESGFGLFTLCGLHYGNSDELLWSDAIFVRRG